jgi:putative tryptophan/tyrosine transport system substrate-binding protein
MQVRRRDFIKVVAGSAITWPLAARAQQSERMRLIGLLAGLAEDDPEQIVRTAAFRQGLAALGWVEGRNAHVDFRFAPSGAQLQVLASELTVLQPDVIVAVGTGMVAAVQRETSTIPIVFVGVSDPIGSGFVKSLARPGGNLTGQMSYEESIIGKWLSMLKEIAPDVMRAALIGNPKTGPFDYFLRAGQMEAPLLAITLVPGVVETDLDIRRTIESIASTPNGSILVTSDATTSAHRNVIIGLAAQHRLPAVYPFRVFVTDGGLMCYAVDIVDLVRKSTSYVDRILRGEKPADLPVQAPTKYETVLNLKTAKALGLTVPSSLLVRADEVIE